MLHQLYVILPSLSIRVADIIPEGALSVYEVSRLNYMYVWLCFVFVFFFDCVSNWKCYIVEMYNIIKKNL